MTTGCEVDKKERSRDGKESVSRMKSYGLNIRFQPFLKEELSPGKERQSMYCCGKAEDYLPLPLRMGKKWVEEQRRLKNNTNKKGWRGGSGAREHMEKKARKNNTKMKNKLY